MESTKPEPEMMETAPKAKKVQIKEIFDHTEATESTDHYEEQKQQHVQVKLLLGAVSSAEKELAQQVADIITERLRSTIELAHDVALLVRIDQCSEGNSRTRACCGELGCGWVVLEAKWSVWNGHQPLITTQTTKMYDSDCLGFADFWGSNHGRNQLLHNLAPKMADKIRNTVLQKCPSEAVPLPK
mmetsp:Transcript_10287/g.19739  ORF Transcript_10287/g.19739 Transcript_10287/m.19739 type:complete len:186 (+) Transcript_10287:135-692(+)|eukprot:scaffold35002_cov160-Amphora_coffeaeformis.AAC.1